MDMWDKSSEFIKHSIWRVRWIICCCGSFYTGGSVFTDGELLELDWLSLSNPVSSHPPLFVFRPSHKDSWARPTPPRRDCRLRAWAASRPFYPAPYDDSVCWHVGARTQRGAALNCLKQKYTCFGFCSLREIAADFLKTNCSSSSSRF